MNRKRFKQAIEKYSEENQIGLHQLKHYLTDGRLIGILEIYDENPYYLSNKIESIMKKLGFSEKAIDKIIMKEVRNSSQD